MVITNAADIIWLQKYFITNGIKIGSECLHHGTPLISSQQYPSIVCSVAV
jgi:hypothetical protein